MTGLTWLLALAFLAGAVLILYQPRACFALWLGSSAAWLLIDLRVGLPAQAALMATCACLASFGIVWWRPRRGPDIVAPPESPS